MHILLVISILGFAAPAFGQRPPSSSPNMASNGIDLCSLESFPSEIKNRLKEEFGSWKIQEPSNLGSRVRQRWEAEMPIGCPGISIGQFENAARPSYAVLLVPVLRPGSSYKLLVFSRKNGRPGYELTILEEWNGGGAENYFIHSIHLTLFSERSRNKFGMHAKDGLLLLDSAEAEYGVFVYFWTKGGYRKEPIDY